MQKLTESNIIFLKAVIADMNIKGEPDEYGNILNAETYKEEDDEPGFWDRLFNREPKTKKVTKKIQIMTLQEIMSKKLGLDYDPNKLVRAIVAGMLDEKD